MKMSLKIKAVCGVLAVALLLSVAASVISYRVYANTMDEHYRTMTMNLAKTEGTMLDAADVEWLSRQTMTIYRQICKEAGGVPDFDHFSEQQWEDYYARYNPVTESECWQSVLHELHKMAAVNDVSSIYICYMDVETRKAVYVIDGSLSEEACRPGTCDEMEEGNRLLIEQGVHDFPAYITNYEEYGWLCSASAGMYNEAGSVIGNAYVDISMDDVMQDRQMFMVRLGIVLLGVTCLLVVFLLVIINRIVVRPVNTLASAAASFVSDREKHGAGAVSAIGKLQIKTGDEIENLAEAIQKMELEINSYIENLTAVTAEKERIGAELNVATQIQADMLPNIFPAFPEHDEFDIYATMAPAKEVGGDFYDFFMVDEDHLAVVMADVSGKGVPAALFMVIAKTLIKNHAQSMEEPHQVFTNVNSQLCENNEVGMFVTGWLGVMDIHTGQMVYVNAGHNYPIIIRGDGSVEWVKSRPGFVLAGMEGVKYRKNELQLAPGDILYLYTDGVTEALNMEEELFGDQRLEETLSAPDIRNMKPEEVLHRVSETLHTFAGQAEQADDITMLALSRMKNQEKRDLQWRKIHVLATGESWNQVNAFLEEQLEMAGCKMAAMMQILIAAEEIFVNIASYAYGEETGSAEVSVCLDKDHVFYIRFEDSGAPYNPLEKQDPDITLSAEERNVGGLGIFMAKKNMDHLSYVYQEGKNCLTMEKKIETE